jgi:hypothetical protein
MGKPFHAHNIGFYRENLKKSTLFRSILLDKVQYYIVLYFQGEPTMINPVNFETRQALEVRSGPLENRREDYPGGGYELFFYEPPRIGSRSDAIALLDELTGAEGVKDIDFALKALRDAVAREVI